MRVRGVVAPRRRPRIDRLRTLGSTAVRPSCSFRTTKNARGTEKSHVSHVALDSGWENMAAYHFERSPHVFAYVKNDHLDFEMFYDWRGEMHRYQVRCSVWAP